MIIHRFPPDDIQSIPIIVFERYGYGVKRNYVMVLMSVLCVLLFATSNLTTSLFGDIGIIATSFLVIMYGSGMLTEVDFNSLSWHTLILVGGGNVLGKAVRTQVTPYYYY